MFKIATFDFCGFYGHQNIQILEKITQTNRRADFFPSVAQRVSFATIF